MTEIPTLDDTKRDAMSKQGIVYAVVLTSSTGTVNTWGPFESWGAAQSWVDKVSPNLKGGTVPTVTELFKA